MTSDLLDPNNTCGRHLLQLVSTGSAIISNILEVSDRIPAAFVSGSPEYAKYLSFGLVQDFSYFRSEGDFTKKLESDASLQEMDDEFRETFLNILSQFYGVLEQVHVYLVTLKQLLADLEEGLYIQHTLDSLVTDPDGKQLMAESLHLLGCMLLLIDHRIEGSTRERMLVSYYRYSGERTSTESQVDDVCFLFRGTGYVSGHNMLQETSSSQVSMSYKRPPNYPDSYLKRAKVDPKLVSLILGRLRSDDIYHQVACFPDPDHRSAALTVQTSILVVCMLFSPEMMQNQSAIMREVVDRFLPDNWILTLHMALPPVNLIDLWEPYKSARIALSNSLEAPNVRMLCLKHADHMKRLIPQLESLLREGGMTESSLLQKVQPIISILRQANVTLRWLMLHAPPSGESTDAIFLTKKSKIIREFVAKESKIDQLMVFKLLLCTSQLEQRVKGMYQSLLDKRVDSFNQLRTESHDMLSELKEVFSGQVPLTRVQKNVTLEGTFTQLVTLLGDVSFEDKNYTTKRITRMVRLMEEVRHQLDQQEGNQMMQVSQYIGTIHSNLQSMLRLINLKGDLLVALGSITDLSYGWQLIDSYTPLMQQGIKQDPSLVIQLRATFLKLASALEGPLIRMGQLSDFKEDHDSDEPQMVKSPLPSTHGSETQLHRTCQFYSVELVSYVGRVLHIIPETMFTLMGTIIQLETNQMKELPPRMMKDQMKEYAQLDHRFHVAQLTHAISVLTQGILMMQTTLVGVIQMDPKQLLEDGIRKELVNQVTRSLHFGFTFTGKGKSTELIQKVTSMHQVMDGFRRSFQYMQDYVCIYGLQLWQEEVTRILNFHVEQECNTFNRTKVHMFESVFQNRKAPIPVFAPTDAGSVTFMGRLAREIIRITDPKITTFAPSNLTWYDSKSHEELVDPTLFGRIFQCMGPSGLVGLDRVFSFMIYAELTGIRRYIERFIVLDKVNKSMFSDFVAKLEDEESSTSFVGSVVPSLRKFLLPLIEKATKSWVMVNEAIGRVGQLQVIRSIIGQQLNTSCRVQARHLHSALQALNHSVLNGLEMGSKPQSTGEDASSKPKLHPESRLMYELTTYLEWVGMTDPLSKVYMQPKKIQSLDLILIVLVLSQVPRLSYCPHIRSLRGRNTDGTPYIQGLVTLMNQYDTLICQDFFMRLSLLIRSTFYGVHQGTDNNPDPSNDLGTGYALLKQLINVGKFPSSLLPNIDHYLQMNV